jgi:NADH-quinone oxidoreductase subunit C
MSETAQTTAEAKLFADPAVEVLASGVERALGVETGSLLRTSFRDNHRLNIEPGRVLQALTHLREAGMDMLIDLSGTDYLGYPEAEHRYGVSYILENTNSGTRIIVRTWADDPTPILPSVFDIWRGSDWMEREVYDMLGIEFTGHPDLRRILLPDEFAGHPLRKDYPLRGLGERHHFVPLARDES